jgi:RND family efflux transporter MFP subunit
VVAVAAGIVLYKYRNYVANPWTRDGQVRANVIRITPRVSGPIVNLPIEDNQLVKAGDLLFEIDPRTFKAAVDQAKADFQQTQVAVDEAKDEADRAARIRQQDRGAVSEQELIRRQNALRKAEATALSAQATLENAQLNLEFTRVKAPVDGYVTNLNLRIGSQAVANQPALALVDIDSYSVHGFFKENYIQGIETGNRAIVTLMGYPDKPLEGEVDSLGWGIAQDDGSTGQDLLPTISATFQWIRLAERVPVRVHLNEIPEAVVSRVGATASVMVRTGTAGNEGHSPAATVPHSSE